MHLKCMWLIPTQSMKAYAIDQEQLVSQMWPLSGTDEIAQRCSWHSQLV